ncbi:hypothetical protein CHH49_13790 [Terribacillus saccharophilus]|nr:hypothetical protein CHH49_13790 [Terribacillus saccharophilus]
MQHIAAFFFFVTLFNFLPYNRYLTFGRKLMNALLIYVHPNHTSLNYAFFEAVQEGIKRRDPESENL